MFRTTTHMYATMLSSLSSPSTDLSNISFPNLTQTFLASESDVTCEKNALVFLAGCTMDKAMEWILGVYDSIGGLVKEL